MPLLTLDEVREFVTTPLSDDALQKFIDAAEAAIVKRYGAIEEITEVHVGGQSVLALDRVVASITSVQESVGDTTTDLTADDYTSAVGSRWLTRGQYGPNYAARWGASVSISFMPFDDTAERIRVAVKLIQLDCTSHPGLTAQQIGEWSETYAANSVFNYEIEREAILASLGQPEALFA